MLHVVGVKRNHDSCPAIEVSGSRVRGCVLDSCRELRCKHCGLYVTKATAYKTQIQGVLFNGLLGKSPASLRHSDGTANGTGSRLNPVEHAALY